MLRERHVPDVAAGERAAPSLIPVASATIMDVVLRFVHQRSSNEERPVTRTLEPIRPCLTWLAPALIVACALSTPAGEKGAAAKRFSVVGDYAEARTCDVWTGPCFANGEMNLRGDHAVMVWSIDKGVYDGVRIDGLKVVAGVDAEGTLGTEAEGPVKTVLFVDEATSKAQRRALAALVRKLAPRYTKNIVKVHATEIQFRRTGMQVALKVGDRGVRDGKAVLELETQPLSAHCDIICGNESKFYPSLAKTRAAHCAKAIKHRYSGKDLGPRWSYTNARSAMVGRFDV